MIERTESSNSDIFSDETSRLFDRRQSSNTSPFDDYQGSLSNPEVNHGLQAQLDVVIPEVSRWRSFAYLCDYPKEFSQITERLADLSALNLQSIDLFVTTRGQSADGGALWKYIFTGGAPMLSRVYIGGIAPNACLPPLSIVTFLRLDQPANIMRGTEFLCILQALPTLVSLHLKGEVVYPSDLYWVALQGGYVEIPTLRFLSFSTNGSTKHSVDSILYTVRCPALQSLTISNLKTWYNLPSSTEKLPLPPFYALRSIKLDRVECSEFIQHIDFTHLSALETISLTECTSIMALLRYLIPSQERVGSDSIWPVLRVIEISYLDAEEFDGLCKIISHRRACDKPIEIVAIDPIGLKKFAEKVEWMKQYVTVRRGEPVSYRPSELFLLPPDSAPKISDGVWAI